MVWESEERGSADSHRSVNEHGTNNLDWCPGDGRSMVKSVAFAAKCIDDGSARHAPARGGCAMSLDNALQWGKVGGARVVFLGGNAVGRFDGVLHPLYGREHGPDWWLRNPQALKTQA